MSSEDNEAKEMRGALSDIANEIQKYQSVSLQETDQNALNNEKMFDALLKYKSSFKLKKEQIRILQQNLKTACIIAKILSVAKTSEATTLHNQLNHAKKEYSALEQQQKETKTAMSTLQAENQTLRNRLQCFMNIIQLGYNELRHICEEPVEDIPILKQLQKIIYCCSQFSANHRDQTDKCTLLEHKNRFLNSRLSILESQLKITTNELQNICKINPVKKHVTMPTISKCINIQCNSQINHSKTNKITHNCPTLRSKKYLDLPRHLNIVRQLLHNQDILLNDLKSISKEFNMESFGNDLHN